MAADHQAYLPTMAATVAGVVIRHVGPVGIYWLSRDQPVTEDELAAGLHADEARFAETLAATERRAEFRRSRYLIRKLTGHQESLVKTASGTPAWPAGLVGSLTHKSGHVGVAFSPVTQTLNIGIDAEETRRMHAGLASRICNATESQLIAALANDDEARANYWRTVVFSFKEALFKCHYPVGRNMFYFGDATVIKIAPVSHGNCGTITARLNCTTTPYTPADSLVTGDFITHSEHDGNIPIQLVLTSVVLMS